MSKEEIKLGHTNKKYRDGDKFILVKNKNGFNHSIDYSLLSKFDFVPKLIKETNEELIWEWIDGEMLENPTDEDLVELGRMIRVLHKSDLKFPKNNFRKRIQNYLSIVHEKGIKDMILEDAYRPNTKLLSRMGKLNPCHNDIWWQNIIKDKNGKLWLVDWEYATMGDKHFDLAYFLESSYLKESQRKIFLDSYNSMDEYQAWIPEWMDNYYLFVNYITLAWALAQDEEPFPLTDVRNAIKKYI